MIFNLDFKKVFVRALFLIGLFAFPVVWGIKFNNVVLYKTDIIPVAILFLFPLIWLLSYKWDYFLLENSNLTKYFILKQKTIPIEDITELSYKHTPATPLCYITFKTGTSEDYVSFPFGLWTPYRLLQFNEALLKINPNISIIYDQKSQKDFEQDKDYHLTNPKNIFGWIALGFKQFFLGSIVGAILIAIRKLLP